MIFAQLLGKLAEHVARLALILHITDGMTTKEEIRKCGARAQYISNYLSIFYWQCTRQA